MRLHFYGGVDTVTGSQHMIEANGHKVLRDCGLFQGRRQDAQTINSELLFDPAELDALVLSHAHIDHCGNIPSLAKFGFDKPIYATQATIELCHIMLRDSARIQEQDAEYLNQKTSREGLPPIKPLYTSEDAEAMLTLFKPVPYHKSFEPAPGMKFVSHEAGHILGSTLSHVTVKENGKTLRIGFVVDLGRFNLPILRDPEFLPEIDVLVMESTYGNRRHANAAFADKQLGDIIKQTHKRGGKTIIPSFALERAQELIFHLGKLFHEKRIPKMPVYVDSPMATAVSKVFEGSGKIADKEFKELKSQIGSVMTAPWVHYTPSVRESKKITESDNPCIVIAASGMCEYGRILHHLKAGIGNPRNSIVIVGWQAPHTLGRRLVERQEMVKIFGETYERRADVKVLNAFSGHGDRQDLINYAKTVKAKKTFLVHGDDEPRQALAEGLRHETLGEVFLPARGDVVDL